MQLNTPLSNKPTAQPMITRSPASAKLTPQQKEKREIKGTIKIAGWIIGVLILLLLINTYILQIFVVNGISMQPTLHTGNVMIVWKAPQTWASITGNQYIPSRYSLVVINNQNSASEQLIKRVIGLPGDTVVINNNIRVFNSANPIGFNPNTKSFAKNLLNPVGTFNTTVAPGQVFLMGDNRLPAASIDSRSSLGNISSKNIIGKVIIRIYPFNQIKLF
jgi:signal peptidase I